MKKNRSQENGPHHLTVTPGFEFKVDGKSIAVEFTDQKLSAHAGSSGFWAWVHRSGWVGALQGCLPHQRPTSNNHLVPLDKALAFMHGVLTAARKLTHVAYLRRDPLLPEVPGTARVPSQSSLSRFFQGFATAGQNLACFRPLWRWSMARLGSRPGGCTLDLDSTRLLHPDSTQEGVRVGYTKYGMKPCLHPLLAGAGRRAARRADLAALRQCLARQQRGGVLLGSAGEPACPGAAARGAG
jgi:hypothetical protein